MSNLCNVNLDDKMNLFGDFYINFCFCVDIFGMPKRISGQNYKKPKMIILTFEAMCVKIASCHNSFEVI